MGVASMVLAILALYTGFEKTNSFMLVVLAILSLIFGIVEVSKRKDKMKSYKNMAIAGIIMSGIVLAINIMPLLFSFANSYFNMLHWMY